MFLFAGPCVIESNQMVDELAQSILEITQRLGIKYVFKASFDKANRTSVDSFRGPGIDKGLQCLSDIKTKYNVPIITDIHEAWQAQPVSQVADIIQIPAFLCRQTDLLQAAAKTGKVINVKKAQFLSAPDMKNVLDKLIAFGAKQVLLCERGSTFGYNRLVVDMTSIYEMKKMGCKVVFDATHSVQLPGGNGNCTGGNREYVEVLAKSAVAAGADGLFMEVHKNPDKALSDGSNMVKLDNLEALLVKLIAVEKSVIGE